MNKPVATIRWQVGFLAAAGAAACVWAPAALADDGATQASLGGQADTGGQLWTVRDLQPSSDVIDYAPAGALWEATATVAPVGGGIPMVPGFAARAGADDYPVLWPVPTAQGINPSSLPAGGTTTGKLYFDVVGAAPTSVVYTADGHDAAVWTAPPPPEAPATGDYTAPRYAPVAPAVTPVAPAAPAPVAVPAPAAPAAPAPAAGSSGTPAAAATTPAPTAGSSGTPAGTPAAPATTPAPTAGSSGTPIAAGATPAPTTAAAPTAAAPTTAAAPAAGAAENPRTNPAAGSAGTPASPALVAPTTTPVPVPAG
jgi:hypothetical protein